MEAMGRGHVCLEKRKLTSEDVAALRERVRELRLEAGRCAPPKKTVSHELKKINYLHSRCALM